MTVSVGVSEIEAVGVAVAEAVGDGVRLSIPLGEETGCLLNTPFALPGMT